MSAPLLILTLHDGSDNRWQGKALQPQLDQVARQDLQLLLLLLVLPAYMHEAQA